MNFRSGQSFGSPIVPYGDIGANTYYWSKRVIDVVVSSLLLVLLSPLFLLIALLSKLDSPGPVFYAQERVGCRRRKYRGQSFWEIQTFRCYKFRSMLWNADPSLHEQYIQDFCQSRIVGEEVGGAHFKLKNDPRITRIGLILRRTSLDELPQLLNAFRGEMSLVGPRPVPVYEVTHYPKEYWKRFSATPGITGLWQVRGRGRVPFEEMIRMDIEYARRRSLWLDLKLLLLTLPAVVIGRGAA